PPPEYRGRGEKIGRLSCRDDLTHCLRAIPFRAGAGMRENVSRLTLVILLTAEPLCAAPRLVVRDGFIIEPASTDGQVSFPMFATFDDRGRLFVTESSGGDLYAELLAGTRRCRVSVLEAADERGRFTRSHVF